MQYVTNTKKDREGMLAALGLNSIEGLFSDIPRPIKEKFQGLELSEKSELEVVSALKRLEAQNADWENMASFLGGGIYDHYIPSIVSHLISRSEFYTAYTPYQPEISQGTLTAMFEFQTMICELTGMEIANASLYDGATALAEAVIMAERIAGRGRVAVARSLVPDFRRVLDTYCGAAGIEIVEVPYTGEGRLDLARIPADISAIVIQSPNAFGVIEDPTQLDLGGGLLIVVANPISLGVLAPPGELGADVVVGEGQPLGLPASFGGPLLGFFATHKRWLRRVPGRISGRTVDVNGKDGYVMAFQTREQHIRREQATSNICTNSALCALAATIYLASLGAEGLKELALLNLEKAHYLADRVCSLPGYELAFQAPFFNEFTVHVPVDPHRIRDRLRQAGFLVTDPGELEALGMQGALRFAVTERRTREQLDSLVEKLGGAK
jgi:glycine dehydrogenase subunit 1